MTTHLRQGNKAYLRCMGQRYLVTILAVGKDTIQITFPATYYPVEGVGVDLEFHEHGGFMCYHTQVIVPPTGERGGMVLQRTPSLTRRKHRGAWRVPLGRNAVIQRCGDAWPDPAYIINVSTEGALITTDAPLRMRDSLMIRIKLPGFPAYDAAAQVIRVDDSRQAGAGQTRYGLYFTGLAPEVKRALTYFLWKRLRELYPDAIRALYPGSRRRRVPAKTQE